MVEVVGVVVDVLVLGVDGLLVSVVLSLLFYEEPSLVVASDEEPSPDCKAVFV